jgi:short-subunit dehydrogenase
MSDRHTVLLTGASSGIGREFARLFAADGHDLVLVARRRAALEQLAGELVDRHGINCVVIARDLAHAGEGATIYAEVEARDLEISILVNNAGFGDYGPFAEADLQRQLAMLRVNVEVLTELTHWCLPSMIEAGRGHVLNVASTAAFQPGPLMAVYYASKAYVLHFSEAIAEELQGTGVKVTAFCPGPTKSGFQSEAGMEASRLVRGPMPSAADVARVGYRAMWRGKRVVVPGLLNRMLVQSVRLSPRRLVSRLVRSLNDG